MVDPLRLYYRAVQERLVQQGRLREAIDPGNAPFTASDLARNYKEIALYNEFSRVGDLLVPERTPAHLRRWTRPLRVRLVFGASVPGAQQRADREFVQRYFRMLSRLTGLGVHFVGPDEPVNYLILVLGRADQKMFNPTDLAADNLLVPEIVQEIRTMPTQVFCTVYALGESYGAAEYSGAVAFIKDAHEGVMRRSCFQEEIAQGLGLPNDSLAARPSIFNDDEEFASLTLHDQLLLRMHYDPRLPLGLRPGENDALIEAVAQDIYARYRRP